MTKVYNVAIIELKYAIEFKELELSLSRLTQLVKNESKSQIVFSASELTIRIVSQIMKILPLLKREFTGPDRNKLIAGHLIKFLDQSLDRLNARSETLRITTIDEEIYGVVRPALHDIILQLLDTDYISKCCSF